MPPRYHVFLSYSSADKAAVEVIARKLREAGIEPFFDEWHLIPGRIWQDELEKALEESRACAIFVGSEGLGPWAKQEMLVALDRGAQDEDFPVIPVLLPGVRKPDKLPGFLRQRTWVEFNGRIDDPGALHRLVCGIRGEQPGADGKYSSISELTSFRSMVPNPTASFIAKNTTRSSKPCAPRILMAPPWESPRLSGVPGDSARPL